MPEEAGAVDTIFAPLGVALGALIAGLIIGSLGYQLLFLLGGIFLIAVVFLVKGLSKREF
jgi:predicted MFS family arabinose efflux permease